MTAAVFVGGRLAHGSRFRAASYDLAQAALVNGLFTTALKFGVGRRRPDGGNRLSFPSGRASNAFAHAAVLGDHYGARAGVPAFVVAGFIGATRLEENVHHPTDVLAGATLGYIVGKTVVRLDARPLDNGPKQLGCRIGLVPLSGPAGSGFGVALHVAF